LKMRYLLGFLAPVLCFGGAWPDAIGAFQRTAVRQVKVYDRPLWDEYGFQQAEQADYESGPRKFTATAYRLLDSTGALGVFDWQRPADATPSALGQLAVETTDSVTLARGNYVLVFKGYKPPATEIDAVVQNLPHMEPSPLPPLMGYLPTNGLVANSERYVTGPVALKTFDPGIPPSLAAFHLGAEAQLASFRTGAGAMTLAIFSYPTPQIARERTVNFQRITGAMAKRAGPLVAVVLSPPDADDAERLLAQIRYAPKITLDERTPTARDNIGNLVVNAFELTGILLVFCVVAGLSFGGFRALRRRAGSGNDAEAMISLNLSDR
jgi:hypothetical protein